MPIVAEFSAVASSKFEIVWIRGASALCNNDASPKERAYPNAGP